MRNWNIQVNADLCPDRSLAGNDCDLQTRTSFKDGNIECCKQKCPKRVRIGVQ